MDANAPVLDRRGRARWESLVRLLLVWRSIWATGLAMPLCWNLPASNSPEVCSLRGGTVGLGRLLGTERGGRLTGIPVDAISPVQVMH